eukprot:gene26416-biopygen16370
MALVTNGVKQMDPNELLRSPQMSMVELAQGAY